MSELAAPLRRVLERTGYLTGAEPAAASVRLAGGGDLLRPPSFAPDAWWRSNPEATARHGSADLKVYFKFVAEPDAVPVAEWQQEVWNQGFCPLLWLVSPYRIDLYNGFGRPQRSEDAAQNRLDTFRLVDDELARLDRLAGRLVMETGQFWRQRPGVDRASAVDRQLLRDLAALKSDLEDSGLAAAPAQALIGRSIFTQYLIDRQIVDRERLERICGHGELSSVLQDRDATTRLFGWLRETFNGDMFPSGAPVPSAAHRGHVRDFLTATDPVTGQRSLFPYRFDVIPVELISAIYEQFVHSTDATGRRTDVHYTPLTAVSLVLDEVFDGLTGAERVLDLTCGSGVFLVEALRRLVYLQSDGGVPTRAAIRRTLHEQVYGVDLSPEAVSIAAFSLYLAALELDPDPRAAGGVRFQPLVGRTLRAGDAFDVDLGSAKFDLIVGNPPWSDQGKAGTGARRLRAAGTPQSPRGQSLDFVRRAMEFAHDRTRFGMILSATPFFSRSANGLAAAQSLVESLGPVTLVNLSDLSTWLFPKADMPAMVLLARCYDQKPDRMTLVQARWSPAGERSHTIEVAPSDVTTLPIASWKRNPGLFKAAFLGTRHDLLLLDDLWDNTQPLKKRLATLGTGMRTGGVPQDDAEAVLWYRRSAEQGNADAQRLLGSMYAGGRGVPQDDAEAVLWYQRSAEQGNAKAQWLLGIMYEEGRGVPQDYEEAILWYQRSAEQGNAAAQVWLGVMYEDGRGVTQDYEEAILWYRRSAEQGNAAAQVWLGIMYEEGRGVPQDDAERVRWYWLSAEQGNAAAQELLGIMYAEGRGRPFAGRGTIDHFSMGDELLAFDDSRAERPRTLAVYRAPLVLIKEFMLQGHPRAVVAVTERDTVFSDAYFAASFAGRTPEAAYLLAGVLGSALASWYFLMTGASFGLWKQRLLLADLEEMPAPDLVQAVSFDEGKRVVQIVRGFHGRVPDDRGWRSLDDAVFELYGLDEEDRIVVQDGLAQARWQWLEGKWNAVKPADEADLQAYARAFLRTMDVWLSAGERRHMRAEIYFLPSDAPLRVIRFILEEGPGPSKEVEVITLAGELSEVLARIGKRTRVQITKELVGLRNLRVHAEDEVSIIKPAAHRNWLRVHALEDADGVVQDTVDSDDTE